MNFNIKTVLRILFVLSCANLQAMNRHPSTDPRPKAQPAPGAPIDYTSVTAPDFGANNSINSSENSEPNTNPMFNQENQ